MADALDSLQDVRAEAVRSSDLYGRHSMAFSLGYSHFS